MSNNSILHLEYKPCNQTLSFSEELSSNTIFTSYHKKGYHDCIIEIPNSSFKIRIDSNFGYGYRSKLEAAFFYNSIPLVDFRKWFTTQATSNILKLRIPKVDGSLSNWIDLFTGIISIYEQREIWNYKQLSLAFKELEEVLNSNINEYIFYKPYPWDSRKYETAGKSQYILRKLDDLLSLFESYPILLNEEFLTLLLQFCESILPQISSPYMRNPSAQFSIECSFDKIYSFLKNNHRLDLLIKLIR